MPRVRVVGMKLRFEPYGAAFEPAVRAFNARLDAGAMREGFRLGGPNLSGDGAASPPPAPVYKETYLAVDGEEVRGGVMLQHQPFLVGGALRPVVNIQLPLSEGGVDNRYASVGMWIIKTVQQRHPLAFAVGMGGMDQPLPKLLRAMGWTVRPVPFFFHVHRPARFLRMLPALQRGGLRTVAAWLGARTGAGWLGLWLVEWRQALGAPRTPSLAAQRETAWGEWADTVWSGAQHGAALVGARDRATLKALYPEGDRYLVFRLRDGARDVGWVVLLTTPMRGSGYFGDLVVGTLLDGLTLPGYERAAVRAAVRVFAGFGVDVSIANHVHESWQAALRTSGYLSNASNYLLATSKALTAAVSAAGDDGPARMHVTRGDGDGRIHL